jgi:hypothetical protein
MRRTNPDDVPGYLHARSRTMDRIKQRAMATSPVPLELASADWPDLTGHQQLARAAIALPWTHWEVAFGHMRPRSANPIAWLRFALFVRAAKREIRRSLDFRYGDHG